MIAEVTTWDHVEPGNYVVARDTEVWRVEALQIFAGRALLMNRQGQTAQVPVDVLTPVTRLMPTHDEAVALAHRVFPEAKEI